MLVQSRNIAPILDQTNDIHVRSDGRGEIDTTEIEHPIIESCPAPPM